MACCEPAADRLEREAQTKRLAAVFAALSHPARIEILQHISKHRFCRCKDITDVVPLAQSTVSQHLKVLVEAELLRCEVVHPSSHYKVNEALLEEVAESTGSFLNACCHSARCC